MTNKNLDAIDESIFSKLEDVIGELAAAWRETKNDEVVRKYHVLLNCLIDMGWKTGPDVEDQLPPELMPTRYFEHIEKRRQERAAEINRRR